MHWDATNSDTFVLQKTADLGNLSRIETSMRRISAAVGLRPTMS
jgi:hypothetical protein